MTGDGVLGIYQAGMDEGNATFETRAPAWRDFDAARPTALSPAAAPTSPDGSPARPVYRAVVEHSVYVRPSPAARALAVGSWRP